MRFCPECEKEIKSNSKFCPYCGLIFFSNLPKHAKEADPVPSPSSPDSQKSQSVPKTDGVSHKICPDCRKKVDKTALACPACGLIFYTKPAVPIHVEPPVPQVSPPRKSHKTQIVAGSLIACLILGFYYFDHLLRQSIDKEPISTPLKVKAVSTDTREFDLVIAVVKHPSGLVWNQRGFVLGNKNARSFLTLVPNGDQYILREAIVGNVFPLTWNGKQFIGYRESGFLESYKKRRFTIHDANSLNVLRELPAPETISGLAWDGTGFWAAARNDSQQGPGILYRLDRNLKVVNKLVSPSSTCRGLAWDGFYLWFLDEVAKKIYVLDVKGVQIRMIGSFEIPVRSASGIAFDGQSFWVSDYDQKSLLRLKPLQQAAWTPDQLRTPTQNVLATNAKRNASVDNYHEPVKDSADDIEVASFSTRMLSNDLYVSWDIHFGENLFNEHSKAKRSQQSFAKITITVDGGSLSDPVAKVYDAHSGRMLSDSFPAFSSLGRGTYHVGLFIYVQYVDKEGNGRVLSKTIPPLTVTN